MKLDVIHTMYNIVTDYSPARVQFIEAGLVAALVKVCKSIDSEATLAVIGRILRELSLQVDCVRVLISGNIHVHMHCCRLYVLLYGTSPDAVSHSLSVSLSLCLSLPFTLSSEGIMPLLLRLSKLEIAALKIDVASALYALSATPESTKLLKLDAVHILFWLTLYDCLALNDTIM